MRQIERSKTNKSYWTKMFLISVAALIVILALRYALFYGFDIRLEQIFTGGPQQTEFPAQCSVDTTGVISNSFTCPTDASSCSATFKLACSNQVSDQQVVFRGSSQTNLPSQIVVDTNADGALEDWTRGTATSSCLSITSQALKLITYMPEPFQAKYIYVYNSKVWICDGATSYQYSQGGSLSTSNVPLSGESCDGSIGFVRCLGTTNAFQCSQDITGSIKKTITYSGSIAGIATQTLTLTPGQAINWAGSMNTIISRIQQSECTKNVNVSSNTYYECISNGNGCGIIDRTVTKTCGTNLFDANTGTCIAPTTCVASNGQTLNKNEAVCTDIYTLQKCITPPTITQTLITSSDQICQNGAIGNAYTANINIAEPIISASEQFNVDFQLTDTSSNKNVPITVTILKNSQVLSTVTQLTGNTVLNAGKTSFTVDAPPVGTYTLRVTFPFANGNFQKDYVVQVSQTLSVIVKADDLVQFDSSPIIVYINSFQSGNYKALTNYEVQATYNGNVINQWTTANPSLGVLKLTFTGLKGDGTLSIKARGEDESGLWTSWTDPFEVSVKKSTILFTSNFPTDVCTSTYPLTFETKDSQGNYVDTQNTVEIDAPDGTKAMVSTSTSETGKYSFSYSFTQGGTYIVRVTSSNSKLGSSQLNSGQGELVNILSGAACNGGGGTGGGTNWTPIVIIGVLVLGVGLFIYFVFIKRSKK